MKYNINLSLDKENIKEILDRSGMVFSEEWMVLSHENKKIEFISRLQIVNSSDINTESMDLIKFYWVGCSEEDIDICILYSIDIEDYLVSINFKFYQTYVDGFKHPILFDINFVDDSLKSILDEWLDEFEGLVNCIDEIG